MDNTAETPTKAAGIFKLGQSAFLHTTTGRCVTFAAGCAALATIATTQDARLAAACGALVHPAFFGPMIDLASDRATERLGRFVNASIFSIAIALSASVGEARNIKNHIQSLPEMKPDTPVMTTAKQHFCAPEQKKGWIEVKGQKLNCGN